MAWAAEDRVAEDSEVLMPGDPIRFVDAHVHHWDLANPWYPAIQGGDTEGEHDAGLGEGVTGLRRDYLRPQYEHDADGVASVTKIVHVSATTAPRAFLDEAAWIDAMAKETGWPAAAVGTYDPDASLATIEADLRAQAESPLFRGARVLFGLDPEAAQTPGAFALFGDAGWVFDLVVHPAEVDAFLPLVAGASSTTFALEHAGWPDSADPDHRAAWRAGLVKLAELPNVHCKISGLGMALQTLDAAAQRPYVEACIEVFGVERCLFGSNFPVDALFGTYAQLLDAYVEITRGLSADDVHRLFVANTEQLYRI